MYDKLNNQDSAEPLSDSDSAKLQPMADSESPLNNSGDETNPPESPTSAEKPDWLPQKFWDAEKSEVRIEDLVKSYTSLEKKLSSTPKPSGDSAPIDEDVPLEVLDATHDNWADALVEWADDLSQQYQVALSQQVLHQHFGGVDSWQKLQPRLSDWGQRNLPREAYMSLASSVEGVKALHRLMQGSEGEPQLVDGGQVPVAIDESSLREMMRDPRYWREREPSFVNRVLAGFKQLYDK